MDTAGRLVIGPGTGDAGLLAYEVPVRPEWVDQLPRSETGKVLRRELAASP